MRNTEDHSILPKGKRRHLVVWVSLGVLVLAAVGLQSQARAVDEEKADGYTTSFSALRDPASFAEELTIVMPRPVVPMTRRDAVAQELSLRNKTMSPVEVLRVAQALVDQAGELGYDPLLFLALIRIESNYNHLAISPVGAEGLMQLMPSTASWMAEKNGLEWPEGHSFDPVLNVELGTRYLAQLHHQFHGHMDQALTAYNRGPTATRYLLRKHGKLPKDIRDFYATKVLDKYRELRAMYGYLPNS